MVNILVTIRKMAALIVCCATLGAAYRMQGTITENGAPVAGTVRLIKYPYSNPLSQTFSNPATLNGVGNFDLTFAVTAGNGEALVLIYSAPGETPTVGSPLTNFNRIFEMKPSTGILKVSPQFVGLPFLTEYSNIYASDLCGMKIKKTSGPILFEFDATSGWCPDEGEKLNTVSLRSFPSGNNLSNGSFEDYGTNYYPGWNTTGLTGLNVAMGSLKPRTGTIAFSVQYSTSAPAGEQAVVSSNLFPVKPNTIYRLSFYYSAKNPSDWGTSGFRPRIRVFAEKNGVEINDLVYGRLGGTPYLVSTDAWTVYNLNFRSGPLSNFAAVDLLSYNTVPIGGTFYFEDVLVTELDLSAPAGSNPNAIMATTTFMDGASKPIQSRFQNGSNDIYAQTDFDELGRAIKSTLPVGGNFASQSLPNGFFPNVWSQANTQYNGSGYPNAGGFAFSESQFEASPLGRPSVHASQGYEWRASGTHTLRNFHSSTTNFTPSSSEPPPASPSTAMYAYELSKGEHNQLSRQFKDKLGRVLRTEGWKSQTSTWVGTDYEYDANGNVSKVTPPAGQGGLRVASTKQYNTLGQLISESSNDFGENRYLYDFAGRLRFTQSQAQRDKTPPRMNYVKYDALDRVIETGEFLDAALFLPEFADDPDFPDALEADRSLRTLNFYDRVPEDKQHCPDGITARDYTIRSDAPLSSQTEFRTLNAAYSAAYAYVSGLSAFNGTIRFIQVFDSPSEEISPSQGTEFVPFQNNSGDQFYEFEILGVLRGSAYDNLVDGGPFPFLADWGPLHGRLVQTVACNLDLVPEPSGSKQVSTVYNYDKYGNIKDVFEYNGYIQDVGKQWQRTSRTFDAQNRLMDRRIYPSASSSSPEVAFSYSYDPLGNLDEVKDIHGVVIGKHHYNAIGQLTRVDVGQGAGQARISYTYHIRGWLKKVEALSPSGVRLFSQDLKYEDEAPTYARYDGLVSSYDYATSTATPDKFTFLYGNLDRLSQAMTTAKASGQSTNPEWGYTYFDNGTFQTANREGQVFTYNYENTSVPGVTKNTHRLNSVSFTGTYPRNTSPVNTFAYDGSGRMQSDVSRDMGIQYSSNDMPYRFAYGPSPSTNVQNMVYDGSGNRRSKLVFTNNNVFVSATHYTGSGKEIREFSNQPLQEIYPLDQFGRVVKNASGQQEYEAYLRNHLGSTVKIHNISTNAEAYRTDYAPYGKLRLQTSQTSVPLTSKFTGKEHDNGTELDYFGARYYDAELGVWTSPDPARQFHSPYSYSTDPINSVDPDGRTSWTKKGVVVNVTDDGSFDILEEGSYQAVAVSQEAMKVGDRVFFNYESSPEYAAQMALATNNNSGHGNWIWAGSQSLQHGYMDFVGDVNSLPTDYSHFSINGTAYEAFKAGNYQWGAAMKQLGFGYVTVKSASELNAFFNAKNQNLHLQNRSAPYRAFDPRRYSWTGDNRFDQQAIKNGYSGK